jgi:tetratricopeptide (TPR) repeat protein
LFLDANGEVNEGKLIRYYRKKVRGWKNAQILVDLYNELLDEDVSARWMQRMEKQNHVSVDRARRWVLATLLTIPPAYLGLSALQPIIHQQEQLQIVVATKIPQVDIEEYKTRIKSLWRSNYANTKDPHVLPEVVARTYMLQDVLLYGKEEQKQHIAPLLCNYLIVCANLYRYQGYFTNALRYFNRALTLSKERNYYELYTRALYLRGFTFFNRWTLWQHGQSGTDLLLAQRDMDAAQKYIAAYKQKIAFSQPLQAALLADGGRAQAYAVQDNQDRLAAIHRIDEGCRIVSASRFQEDPYFLRIDADWCFLDKAEASTVCGWPGLALQELEQVRRGDASLHQRYLYTYILEAEASIAKGWVEVGIAHLEDALLVLNETTSRRHLNRVVRICDDLKQNERYGNSPDVARLEVKILMARHPEIFQ